MEKMEFVRYLAIGVRYNQVEVIKPVVCGDFVTNIDGSGSKVLDFDPKLDWLC